MYYIAGSDDNPHCDDDDLSPAGFPILKAGLDFLFEHLEISWRQSQYKPLIYLLNWDKVSHLFTLPLGAPSTIKNWLTQHFTICSKNEWYHHLQKQILASLKFDGCACAQVPSCNCHREKWKRPGTCTSLSCYLEFYWQSELICTKNHSSWLLLAEQTNLYKLLFNLICKKKSIFIENRADHQVCKNIFAEETDLKQLLFKLLCR